MKFEKYTQMARVFPCFLRGAFIQTNAFWGFDKQRLPCNPSTDCRLTLTTLISIYFRQAGEFAIEGPLPVQIW
jgi:hypothetical protein